MGSAEPSQSGVDKHKGTAAGGRPGPAPSRGGGVRASEGTNPCTRPSFATKNVFDVLQDLSESIGGSPGPQLDAADGQPEPIVHDLHQSLVELLERPEILSLHAVRRVGRERQLHLKVRALCGEVEEVFYVLVDTGAQVSLVKAGLLPPECLSICGMCHVLCCVPIWRVHCSKPNPPMDLILCKALLHTPYDQLQA